jgi:hypothetical protein
MGKADCGPAEMLEAGDREKLGLLRMRGSRYQGSQTRRGELPEAESDIARAGKEQAWRR